MKYAFVDGIKQEPIPKQSGICCLCGSPTISKCGTSKVWHWAHKSLENCDSWWENETLWHRLWKSYFNKDNQEVIHFDENTREKHIADIKTNNGTVIEIQNSPMSEDELRSRENFYGKMFWIVNGEKFKNNFKISGLKLPRQNCELFQDIVFQGYRCYRKSENVELENCLKLRKSYNSFVKVYSRSNINQDIENNYIGHHLFEWKHPRSVWFNATKPVFIDFGDEFLWWVKKYYDEDYRNLWCVQKICKHELINKNGGKYKITHINNE
jgi:competence protein CoiA